MPYVVTGRCVDCRYTYCVEACPCQCFFEITEPRMLVINPEQCIDCDLCVEACPVNAIYPDNDLPAEYAEWEAKNAELWAGGVNVVSLDEPLASAKLLEEVQAEERAKGWKIKEPPGAAG